jgi:hypothetical protein
MCEYIPDHHDQSTWAKLGLESEKILARCLVPNPASKGGQCIFGSYLDYNLDNNVSPMSACLISDMHGFYQQNKPT